MKIREMGSESVSDGGSERSSWMILKVSGMVPGVYGMVSGIYGRFWKNRKGPNYYGRFWKCPGLPGLS